MKRRILDSGWFPTVVITLVLATIFAVFMWAACGDSPVHEATCPDGYTLEYVGSGQVLGDGGDRPTCLSTDGSSARPVTWIQIGTRPRCT